MKNKLWILTIILLIVFIVNSCSGDEEKELTKDQSATLENLFGEGFSANVKGCLKDSEWDGVAGKIESALNGAFDDNPVGIAGAMVKNRFRNVFGDGVTIIVEKTTVYSKYKVADGAFRTLYINSSVLDVLQADIVSAITAMDNQIPTIE